MLSVGLEREAAELDGAAWWRRLWHVTLPQIRPEIYVVLLWYTIAALKVFGAVYVLTKGGPGGATNVPSYFSLQNFFQTTKVGYGSAVSTVLTVLILALALANGPLSLPDGLYLDGLKDFWQRVDFGQKLVNSVLLSGSVAVFAVVLSVLNAYAIGIGRIKGRPWVLAFFVLANMLPQEALVYPVYYLSKEAGLYDTRLSVILVFTVIQSASGGYPLSSVLGAFPKEVIKAARIDGANKWRVLWRVVVPASRPTIGVLLVFFFIWTWNEFLLPLVMLISNDNQTVSVALGVLQGQRLMDATMTNAAALLGVLPAVLFFLVFQRTLTRGIAVGAVK